MTEFTRSYDIQIAAPVHEVFDYCRDPRHLLEGWPGLEVTDVVITPDGVGTTALYVIRPGGVGTMAHIVGRLAKGMMVEQIDREYTEFVPDQRIVSRAKMARRFAGRTKETANSTVMTWLFKPRNGGTELTVNFLEEDLAWWQNLLDNAAVVVLSKHVHSMLAAVKEGVEGQASPTM